ncbi:MAG: hypothetical protein LQ344_005765 [Seirophora lacunosa]|nr:MAG: hypothetical protein LQ344_005765 [Seirophora lacunosa]
MRSLIRLICLLCICALVVHGHPHTNDTQVAASKQIKKWQHQYNKYIFKTLAKRSSGCTIEKLQFRREWSSLSPESRIEYTNAVQYLQRKPNLISNTRVPGARNRFDNINIISPILQPTGYIPPLASLLHLLILLRTECGYTGPQPYWDWTLSYKEPRQSKIFDGSVDSMGSNGAFVPGRNGTYTTAWRGNRTIPAATGGGCVTSGPFMNYTVNLGSASFEPRVALGTGLDYNPRCLKRDVSLDFANNLKPTDVVDLIGGNSNFEAFTKFFETSNGLHASGHFIIGGDPGNDGFASAGDPIFYLHHGQLDRLWTIWQVSHVRISTGQHGRPTTRIGTAS